MKNVLKSSILDNVMNFLKARETALLSKKMTGGKKKRKLYGIEKLEDANDAGTAKSSECTLILTEGDSAKSLAMSGIQVVGRDKFGVYPLRGKLLNVRDAGIDKLKNNPEIQDIVKILGLKFGEKYTDTTSLRYGSIMIMADQDHDGSHIKGLVINLIHCFWPSLMKLKNFMREFITPIIKVRKGDISKSFFTMGDYHKWEKETEDVSKYSIKYYKGLGTSTSQEAKEYFKNINVHRINFLYQGKPDDDALDLAFNKKNAEKRKEWLATANRFDYIDHSKKEMHYEDFVNKELVHFSVQDCNRAIPSVMDGLKPSQRKILFSCFKRNLSKEIKVAQLAGYVSEHSAYHHGEQSLCQAIINMAQNFVGSNNINLLKPIGQFGSRHLRGKEAASPRYIYTSLSKLTRMLFKDSDDPVLNYLEEEGMKIEPEFYAPIIPMVLVNGCEGIGTGWSTKIPCYNPLQLVENVKLYIKGKEMHEILPWFKGYQGTIEQKDNSVFIQGDYKEDGDELEITEIPITLAVRDYKTFLEKFIETNKISDLREFHTENRVHFILEGCQIEPDKLKLEARIDLNNFVCFDSSGAIKK